LTTFSDASPRGAERVKQRIQRVIELLLDQPRIGAPTDDPTIRRLSTPPYPFLIFYEIAEDEIVIHAVRHAARDPSTMPGSE
jgi:toxin ParE1/3/4